MKKNVGIDQDPDLGKKVDNLILVYFTTIDLFRQFLM